MQNIFAPGEAISPPYGRNRSTAEVQALRTWLLSLESLRDSAFSAPKPEDWQAEDQLSAKLVRSITTDLSRSKFFWRKCIVHSQRSLDSDRNPALSLPRFQ
jgi:hypothetical protein